MHFLPGNLVVRLRVDLISQESYNYLLIMRCTLSFVIKQICVSISSSTLGLLHGVESVGKFRVSERRNLPHS